ncbi:MAG: hypothetical protein U5R31_15925 [Acidimicrobiia bacterium]|nr:hypothetical protein [Acidimicrobiia bacterium]
MSVRSSALAAATGLVVGVGLTAVLVSGWHADDEPDHGVATVAFLEAWERSRSGTYLVRSDFHRSTARGGELESSVEVVQRPPDRLVRQYGSVAGRLDGSVVSCGPDPAGEVSCGPRSAAPETYEETTRRQLADWRELLVEGSRPTYRVVADGDDCFDLTLDRDVAEPPYGSAARFCFDGATGALRYERIEREEGTDVTEAVEIRSQVDDADFRLPS